LIAVAKMALSTVGKMAPTVPVRRDFRMRAPGCGTYPSWTIAACTRSRSALRTPSGAFTTRETVAIDTLATRATSLIVGTGRKSWLTAACTVLLRLARSRATRGPQLGESLVPEGAAGA